MWEHQSILVYCLDGCETCFYFTLKPLQKKNNPKPLPPKTPKKNPKTTTTKITQKKPTPPPPLLAMEV